MEIKERKAVTITMNCDLLKKAKHQAVSKTMTFSSYIEALILQDVSQ